MSDSYKDVLRRADAFFGRVFEEQRQQMQCGRGCSLCCFGLFEIGSGDVPVIAEGLARLHPMRRRKIIRRALAMMDGHPNLRECSAAEKEAFFNRTSHVPCPNLSEAGECMIYESRPLVCRTFGLPLREDDRYIGDVCELNFNDASDEQKLAASWDLRWEDELGPEDEFTVPEAIVLAARLRGWLR
jgi:Fe-S-cluster containining protein